MPVSRRRLTPSNANSAFNNPVLLQWVDKDGTYKTLKLTGAHAATELFRTLSMGDDPSKPKLLATFSSGSSPAREIGYVYQDNMTINESSFPAEVVEKLKVLASTSGITGIRYDGTTKQFLFDSTIMPPSPYEVDSEHGTISLNVKNGSTTYSCSIGPLGAYVKVTLPDGSEQEFNGLLELKDFLNLTPEEAQKQIVNVNITPQLLVEMTEKKDPPASPLVKQPTKVADIPLQYIDSYFALEYRRKVADLMAAGKDPSKDPSLIAGLRFPPDGVSSRYSFLAVPTPDSTPENPKFYYLAKDARAGKTKNWICDNGTWQGIDGYNYVQDAHGELHIAFTPTNRRNSLFVVNIPTEMTGTPPVSAINGDFVQRIVGFVGENPAIRLSKNPHAKPAASYAIAGGTIDFQTYPADVKLAPVRPGMPLEESTETLRTPHPSVDKVRKNPYVPQPKKAVKKEPRKLNEDAILYGGGTLGLFLMFMVAIPVIGAFLFAAGVAVFTASMLISANIHAFNNNPYNGIVTQYINQLNSAQNEAEDQAKAFWEAEFEYANERDLLALVGEEKFRESSRGAMFAKMFDTPEAYSAFWERPLEYKQQFLADLQSLMAVPDTDPDLVTKQREFLTRFGIDVSHRDQIFSGDYVLPDPSDPTKTITLPARDAIGQSMDYLFNTHIPTEQSAREHLRKKGDILRYASGLSIERIMAQDLTEFYPGLSKEDALTAFVADNATDLAGRFVFGSKITDEEREIFFSKLTQEGRDILKKQLEDFATDDGLGLEQARLIGSRQKTYDNAFEGVLRTLKVMEECNKNKELVSKIVKYDDAQDRVKTLVWAIANEDAKRNSKARSKYPKLDTTSLASIYAREFSGEYKTNYAYKSGLRTPEMQENSQAYLDVLAARQAVFNNPIVMQILTDQTYDTGVLSSLLSSKGKIDEDSLAPVLRVLASDSRITADATLSDNITKALTLQAARSAAKKEITEREIDKLFDKTSHSLKITESAPADIDAKVKELLADPKYAILRPLPDPTDPSKTLPPTAAITLARLMLDGEKYIDAKIKSMGSSVTPATRNAALAELNAIIEQLATGHLAEKFLCEDEKSKTKDATFGASQEVTPEKAREDVIQATIKGIRLIPKEDRKFVLQQASIAAGADPISPAHIIQALYDKYHYSILRNATDRIAPHDESLEDIMSRLSISSLDDPKDLSRLISEVQKMRQDCEKYSEEQLEPLKDIAGETQIDYEYDVKRDKRKAEKNTKPISRRQKRATQKYQDAVKATGDFIKDANVACDNLDTIQKPTTPPADRQAAIQSLETYVKGDSDLKKIVKGDLKEAGLSWKDLEDKAASGTLSPDDINKLKEIIRKAIKKKDKKMSTRLKKKRKKAAKHDKDNQRKPVTGKDMDENITSTQDSIDHVDAKLTGMTAYNGEDLNAVAGQSISEIKNDTLSHKIEHE